MKPIAKVQLDHFFRGDLTFFKWKKKSPSFWKFSVEFSVENIFRVEANGKTAFPKDGFQDVFFLQHGLKKWWAKIGFKKYGRLKMGEKIGEQKWWNTTHLSKVELLRYLLGSSGRIWTVPMNYFGDYVWATTCETLYTSKNGHVYLHLFKKATNHIIRNIFLKMFKNM